MAAWVDDIKEALTQLGGVASRKALNDRIAQIRQDPLTTSWEMTVQKTIQRHSSDISGYKPTHPDLFFAVEGVGKGIWGLRAAVQLTPVAADLSPGEENPGRVPQITYRILRDTKLAREIKLLHRNECQICGLALMIGLDKTYAEAHHIIPLGRDHSGPDKSENILVVCPNHHAQCDMGAIRLERLDIHDVDGHTISDASIRYHNTQIYKGP